MARRRLNMEPNYTEEQLGKFARATHDKIATIKAALKGKEVDQAFVDEKLKEVIAMIGHAGRIDEVATKEELLELWKELRLWPVKYTQSAWDDLIEKQRTINELGGKSAKKGGRKAKKSHKKGYKGGKKSHKKGHKGARSKTRRGRLDFITHKGSKVFNRRSHYQKKTAKGVKKSPY